MSYSRMLGLVGPFLVLGVAAHADTEPAASIQRTWLADRGACPSYTEHSIAQKSDSPIVPSQHVPDYRWVKVTLNAAFAPRDGAGALVFRGRMWLLGGWNPGDKVHFPRICNNEVWSSRDGLTWTLIKPNTFLDDTFDATSDWEGRHTAGYVVYDDKMWVVGGDVNQRHYHNDNCPYCCITLYVNSSLSLVR